MYSPDFIIHYSSGMYFQEEASDRLSCIQASLFVSDHCLSPSEYGNMPLHTP